MTRDPPLYPGLPALGSLLDFRRDAAVLLRRAASDLGPIVRFKVGPRVITMVADPDLIGEVLLKRHRHYLKQTRAYKMLRDGLGQGLLTSDGEVWVKQRRISSPTFRRDQISGLAGLIVEGASALGDQWAERPGEIIDAVPAFHRLAMRIAGRAFLGEDVGPNAESIRTQFDRAITITTRRVLSPWATPIWVPTPTNLRLRASLAEIDRVVGGIIEHRRGQADKGDDFLGRLMSATDEESGTSMSDLQLLNEVKTLFIAGFETVSTALSWSLYELGRHPEWQRRVREEARVALQGPASMATMAALPVTRRVFLESLRHYPPIWAVGRTPIEDESIGEYRVPAGSWVFPSPYVVHHLEQYWPEPDVWDPDRHLPEMVETRPKHSFLPFLIGPRRCIGEHFAMMEGVLIIACLAARVQWETMEQVLPRPVVTLRPAAPIRLKLSAVS
jgi:cytochrome P450